LIEGLKKTDKPRRDFMMVCSTLKRTAGIVSAVFILTFMCGVMQADAWWDAKWQHRKKVAFDASNKGGDVKESLTDVPVLVRLHSGNFAFANAKKDGSDLRFVSSDDKSPLKFHIEKFDPKLEIALVWVKVPKVTGAGTTDSVWLYYGNESVPAGQEAGATYDTAQVLNFHLNEADGSPKDATAYGNHGATFSGKLGTQTVIGNGATFKGGADKIVVPRSPSINFDKGFSFSTWVRFEQPQKDARLFSWQEGAQSLVVGIDGDKPFVTVAAAGKPAATATSAAAMSLKAWHHVAVSAEPGKRLTLFLDGQEAAGANLGAVLPSPAADLNFAISYVGDLDEIQVANVPRPAAWFTAAVAGQGAEGKLTTYLQEENGEGGGENLTIRLIKVTARSITFDGWLIIGLCTFMLFMAAAVFVNKFTRLQKIKRGNEAFLESFNQLHDPLELDQNDDSFRHSSLFRIYQAGYDRVMNWVEKREETEGDVSLTTSAMNIFRAALDRANSEELKKMNAWMIVLTLGISGGPFWGLLGTVWGVMNTFASLAEAGEANLSAIAPGVASALACTLFGLFVAIPALFAYSFLIMHMKNLNVETRHFIEEYALRVEGFHGKEEA
jgi:biopolymer transport protein ExbB